MVKARQLKSGAWNIQAYSHMENNRPVYKSITGKTKQECENKYHRFVSNIEKEKKKIERGITVKKCVEDYIEVSRCVLSPTTLSAYRKVLEYSFAGLMDKRLSSLTDKVVQEAINSECERTTVRTNTKVSPKTIKNEWGLLASALKAKGYTFNVRLPRQRKNIKILPPVEQVLERIVGSEIELPCLLSMWCSLRLSEVRGLKCDKIKDYQLIVDNVVVKVDGKDIEKQLTKTSASTRIIQISPYLMRMINNTDTMINYRETGENQPLITIPESTIRHTFYRLTKGLNITYHDLRHYYATINLSTLAQPSKIVQKNGGWATPVVMESVYNNIITTEEQKAYINLNNYFENLLNALLNAGGKNAENVDISRLGLNGLVGSSPMSCAKQNETTDE